MRVPDRVTAGWIEALADTQLMTVELRLHTEFLGEENDEKKRRGDDYALLQGPAALVNAWVRWQMVSNEVRTRRLLVRRRK
jgi:hypothetical protein